MSKKNTNLCAILAYLLVGVVWYFVDKKMQKDKSVKFHVKQAIILFIAWIIWSVVVSVLGMIAPFLGPLIAILWIVPWVFVVLGIINALNKKQKKLPFIGEYAKKLTF